MDPNIHPNIIRYTQRNQLQIVEPLGFGVHGSVVSVVSANQLYTAVKHVYETEPFQREFDTYQRLSDYRIDEVCGFSVPELIAADENLRILEMTLVTRPFVLDFAGAYLESKPHFSAEIWADWEARQREQFGDRWPIVREVIDAFEEMGIYLLDVHASNVAFRD